MPVFGWRLIVDDGWPPSVAAKMFMVSTVTARKWAARFRAEGVSGMQDRSSRPRSMPSKTPLPVVKRIVKARCHSRVAYVEMHADERSDTAIGVLRRAVAWFAERGVTVERVLSDNGAAHRSYA